tara:strand:- start:946 stop:1134 length:189 start_codon:yes stop_codon:yes gene_type:complete
MTKLTRKAGERLSQLQELSKQIEREAGYSEPNPADVLAYEQLMSDLEAHHGDTMDYASRLRV